MMICQVRVTDIGEVKIISYSSVCEVINSYFETSKIPDDLRNEALSISCAVQSIVEKEDAAEIMVLLNVLSVFDQVTPEDMGK